MNETNENAAINEEGAANETAETKTYTQEEVDKLLQAEADRRVSQALSKQQKKYEQKLSLSQLDEQSREKAEKDMKIQELEEQLSEFRALKAKNEVNSVLASRGLNPLFTDIIGITGKEETEEIQRKIETLDKIFKAAVADEVKKRLSSSTPKVGISANHEMTKEEFNKLTLAQQSALYVENPELYNKLTK